MEQKEPIKITLGFILRWILGLFFMLFGVVEAFDNHYLAAVFMILGAFVLIPPISQIVESNLNISLSGPLRLVIVILLFVGFVYALPPTTPSHTPDSNLHNSSISQSTTDSSKIATSISDDNVCYYDWKWYTTDHIGNYDKASAGSTYAVVTIYLKNKSDKSASTNPLDWYLLIDGLKYTYDLATFDSSINHLTYDVMKGAETETRIVYLVKGYPQNAELKYDQWFGPELKHIDHYDHSNNFKVQ
jgi:Domain of unknown function (DUF4352)